ATSNLAHHSAWRGCVRLGDWWRDIFTLVAVGGWFCLSRRVDDFPKRRSSGTGDSGGLVGTVSKWARLSYRAHTPALAHDRVLSGGSRYGNEHEKEGTKDFLKFPRGVE